MALDGDHRLAHPLVLRMGHSDVRSGPDDPLANSHLDPGSYLLALVCAYQCIARNNPDASAKVNRGAPDHPIAHTYVNRLGYKRGEDRTDAQILAA